MLGWRNILRSFFLVHRSWAIPNYNLEQGQASYRCWGPLWSVTNSWEQVELTYFLNWKLAMLFPSLTPFLIQLHASQISRTKTSTRVHTTEYQKIYSPCCIFFNVRILELSQEVLGAWQRGREKLFLFCLNVMMMLYSINKNGTNRFLDYPNNSKRTNKMQNTRKVYCFHCTNNAHLQYKIKKNLKQTILKVRGKVALCL